MTTPDFLIIGAMKCGTSTLQTQLAAQPGVFMTTPKEPNFFSDDPIYAKGMGWYGALFDGAAPGDLKGEASTHYTKRPTWPDTVARLQAAVPNPRLIYMIRNPIDRCVSHYIHDWSEGRLAYDLDTAIEKVDEITAFSQYAMQITPFVEAFGADRILLTSLEAFKRDGAGELARIGAFIGLRSPTTWQDALGPQNVSARRVRRIPLQGVLLDNPVAETLRRTLVPKSVRTRIRKARTMNIRPVLQDRTRNRLRSIFLEDRAALAQIFPDHPALTDCYPFSGL
ncbi:MAG: sulfotransferase [Pseudomonadota bacterium]